MAVARAISALRKKAGISQRELAEKLGTATETVSRWETGRREPNNQTLKQLADIAESEGLDSLRALFERQRRSGIAARIKNLPSAGTQRRVSVDDLESWESWAEIISGATGVLLGDLNDKLNQEQRDALSGLKGAAELLRTEIHLHIKGSAVRPHRLSEEEIARLRQLHIPEDERRANAKTE